MTTLGELLVIQSMTTSGGGYQNRTYRQAQIADLVSVLRAEGAIVIEKVNGEWPEWITDVDGPIWYQCGMTNGLLDDIFDALAEAQPFPPAGVS